MHSSGIWNVQRGSNVACMLSSVKRAKWTGQLKVASYRRRLHRNEKMLVAGQTTLKQLQGVCLYRYFSNEFWVAQCYWKGGQVLIVFLFYLGVVPQVQSPTIRFLLWMVPIVTSPQPVTKERVKAAFSRGIIVLVESKMPLQQQHFFMNKVKDEEE